MSNNKIQTTILIILSAVLGLLTLVCAANIEAEKVAQLQLEQKLPDDDEEIRNLSEENKIFSDYCIESRDEVKSFLMKTVKGAAIGAFQTLFTPDIDAQLDFIKIQHREAEDLKKVKQEELKVRDNVEGIALKWRAKDNIVNDSTSNNNNGRRKNSLLELLGNVLKAAANGFAEAAKEQVAARQVLIQQQFQGENLKETLELACRQVTFELQNRLEIRLLETKNKLRKISYKSPNAQSINRAISKARTDNIGCATGGRVSKMAKLCSFVDLAVPFAQLLGSRRQTNSFEN